MGRPYSLAITVDVEGSWYQRPVEQSEFELNKLKQDLAVLTRELDGLEQELGQFIPVSWFMRCDDSIAARFQCNHGMLKELSEFIERRNEHGDVFGLHPHLYQLHDDVWSKQIDPQQQYEQLCRSADSWQEYFGTPARLSRIGEATMNEAIARGLQDIGVYYDTTALPGRFRVDADFSIDWQGTPHRPYYPAQADYRRPASNNEPAWSFLEIPFTMLPIQASYDQSPLPRYFNLAFMPELIRQALQRQLPDAPLITVVHPHELTDGGERGKLAAFETNALRANLQTLQEMAPSLAFKTVTEIAEEFSND